tara:strand:+ start:2254 stop:2739 length:486 start_codon:yes stop_codon:yes gene_type:complete
MKKPLVLDACCGGRMFWYDKENPDALFMDCREIPKGFFPNGWNPNWSVDPDVIADFRNMPFPEKRFKMVVYDPPHLHRGSEKSVMNKKYGLLNKETWELDLVAGFKECWRVLDDYGVLIFKWNEANIKTSYLIKLLPHKPLFGNFTGKSGNTIWMSFIKNN